MDILFNKYILEIPTEEKKLPFFYMAILKFYQFIASSTSLKMASENLELNNFVIRLESREYITNNQI